MARKTSRSKASAAKAAQAKADAVQKPAEAETAAADTAAAPDAAKDEATAATPSADATPDPATETSTDADAAAEDQAIAASASAQDNAPESDVGGEVDDASPPEAPQQAAQDAPPESDPLEGAEGAAGDTPAPNSPTLTADEKVAALNAAIAEIGEDAVLDQLKDQLCDPAFEIVVVGPRQGRWRAGRQFGQEAVVIPAEELTFDQFTMIRDDRALLVQVRAKSTAIEA